MPVLGIRLTDADPLTLAESEKSREVYWGFTPVLEVLWWSLVAASMLVFVFGLVQLFLKYRRGRHTEDLRLLELPRRIVPTLVEIYSHRQIGRREPTVKWAHRAILFGFTVLFIGTVLVAVNTDLTVPLLGWNFLSGNFYIAYKFVLNVFGVFFLVGLVAMMIRRGISRPAKLDYTPQDPSGAGSRAKGRQYVVGDWAFVASLLIIGITGYALQGVRLAMDDPGFELAQFGGVPFAWVFDMTLGEPGLIAMRYFLWWLHGVMSLAWVASIPFTKASHMFTSVVNLALRPIGQARATASAQGGSHAR